MKALTLKQLCRQSYALSKKKGWYGKDGKQKRNIPEMLMLMVSEIAEALEDYRTGKMAMYRKVSMDNKPGKPCGFSSEMADLFIRAGDLCELLGIDIDAAIREKHEYNKTRPYRHGGKKC